MLRFVFCVNQNMCAVEVSTVMLPPGFDISSFKIII